jgi:hypothetical protein
MRIWLAGLSVKSHFGGTHLLSALSYLTREVRCTPKTLAVRDQAEMAVATHPTTAKRMDISGYP